MFHLLYKYLVFHNYVKIPGVGHFTIEKQPARIDMESKIIHAPVSVIKYRDESDVADKSFYTFLANELKIEVVDAVRQFQDFYYQLKNSITAKKVVELPSFGTLKLVNNQINFQQTPVLEEYYPDISIDRPSFIESSDDEAEGELVTEEDSEEVRPARSFWWLYALILGLIGVGAIVYYYYYLGNTFN